MTIGIEHPLSTSVLETLVNPIKTNKTKVTVQN